MIPNSYLQLLSKDFHLYMWVALNQSITLSSKRLYKFYFAKNTEPPLHQTEMTRPLVVIALVVKLNRNVRSIEPFSPK